MDSVELQEITISVLAIAFAFSLVQLGGGIGGVSEPGFWLIFLITVVTVGLGFVLHELAHRHIARQYGAYAIFRAWPTGLLLMIGLAVIGSPFLFAAPGAVMIYASHISREENGIISAAGPLTNIALALLFAFGMFGLASATSGLGQLAMIAFNVGFSVNVFLALFNLIPVFPLDGSKVYAWDWRVWGGMVGFCLFLMFVAPAYLPQIAAGA